MLLTFTIIIIIIIIIIGIQPLGRSGQRPEFSQETTKSERTCGKKKLWIYFPKGLQIVGWGLENFSKSSYLNSEFSKRPSIRPQILWD